MHSEKLFLFKYQKRKTLPSLLSKTSSRPTSSSSTSTTTFFQTTTRLLSSSGCLEKTMPRSRSRSNKPRASSSRGSRIRVVRQSSVIFQSAKRIPKIKIKTARTRTKRYNLTFSRLRMFLASTAIILLSSDPLLTSSLLKIAHPLKTLKTKTTNLTQ